MENPSNVITMVGTTPLSFALFFETLGSGRTILRHSYFGAALPEDLSTSSTSFLSVARKFNRPTFSGSDVATCLALLAAKARAVFLANNNIQAQGAFEVVSTVDPKTFITTLATAWSAKAFILLDTFDITAGNDGTSLLWSILNCKGGSDGEKRIKAGNLASVAKITLESSLLPPSRIHIYHRVGDSFEEVKSVERLMVLGERLEKNLVFVGSGRKRLFPLCFHPTSTHATTKGAREKAMIQKRRVGLRILRLHHVSIPVRNLERSKAFYGGILGLKEIRRASFPFPGAWFELSDRREIHLVEHPPGTFREVSKGTDGENITANSTSQIDPRDVHFAIRVDDFEAATAYFLERKVPIVQDPLLLRHRQAYIVDPDLHVIEINTPIRVISKL